MLVRQNYISAKTRHIVRMTTLMSLPPIWAVSNEK